MKIFKIIALSVIFVLVSLIFIDLSCRCNCDLKVPVKNYTCKICKFTTLIKRLIKKAVGFSLFLLVCKLKLSKIDHTFFHIQEPRFPVLLKVRLNQ